MFSAIAIAMLEHVLDEHFVILCILLVLKVGGKGAPEDEMDLCILLHFLLSKRLVAAQEPPTLDHSRPL